jgi:hypothetical protein
VDTIPQEQQVQQTQAAELEGAVEAEPVMAGLEL